MLYSQVKFDSYLANPDSLILPQASQLHSTKVRYVAKDSLQS